MINVFDPLFTIDTTKDAVPKDNLDDKITESVEGIAGAMGFKTVTPLGNDTDSAPNTLAALDELYVKDSVFVIPIIYETPVSSAISNDYSASCYVSYLVITIKSGDVAKPNPDVTTAPFYSATANDGKVLGTLTTDAENYDAMIVPTGTEASTGIRQVAGVRLINYRFYRNATDDYPLIFDNISTLAFGYKKTGTDIDEIVLRAESYSFSLIQQVMCLSTENDDIFPIAPTDYESYLVAPGNIKAFGSTNAFSLSTIPFKLKDGSTEKDIGFATPYINQTSFTVLTDTVGKDILCCRIYNKIYTLKAN